MLLVSQEMDYIASLGGHGRSDSIGMIEGRDVTNKKPTDYSPLLPDLKDFNIRECSSTLYVGLARIVGMQYQALTGILT